jgi:hypothetical protein
MSEQLASDAGSFRIISFSNQTSDDRAWLKRFVDFHWSHYRGDESYIPLLNYEYLGFKLIGMTGFFEPRNLFFKHGEMRFFLALSGDRILGRCNAFVNHGHNSRWSDKVGFFGQFETVDDPKVSAALLDAASEWLKSRGMDRMRGPQNLPVNEATPGVMTEGFDSRPVLYYHYNKPYYAGLLESFGMSPVKRVMSWEVPPSNPMEERLVRVGQKVVERYGVTFETWDERPLKVRKREMFEVYNDAWYDNFGFVPFTEEEFYKIADDMQLIIDKKLFLFTYVRGELAGFFGGVPNIMEKLKPVSWCPHCELLRAIRMILGKGSTKGYRLGYLGVKRKFHHLGLDGVMLWRQKIYSQEKGYEYCDMGWVLEDNKMVTRVVDSMSAKLSKVYTIFEKPIA